MIQEWLEKRRTSRVQQQKVVILQLLGEVDDREAHVKYLRKEMYKYKNAYDALKIEIKEIHLFAGIERTSPSSNEENHD